MKVDQLGQDCARRIDPLGYAPPTVEQKFRDSDKQFDEHGLLVRKVPIHRRATYADCSAEILEANGRESTFGEQ